MQRKTDKNKQVCFRSARMFEDDGLWFFNTRDGKVVGPFQDDLQASTQLEVYIRMVESGLLREGETYCVDKAAVKTAG